ncbi:MAG: MarR family transcriptional regulator [Proteobacteria bacterium]|nr:MarR family transcriptional regulator [Pseudomonadota bacterium]MBU1710230.1 MarR family transcriptional regulator [Pseudomonadota bacterium]
MTCCKEDSLARQIYITSQEMRNFAEKVLKPYDLTLEQLHLLKNMPAESGLSQREICDAANKNPANMTRILDRLEAKELVIRRDNPDDRRASLVFITKQGSSLVSEVHTVFDSFSTRLLNGISDKDQTQVIRSLEKISKNLNAMSADIENQSNT